MTLTESAPTHRHDRLELRRDNVIWELGAELDDGRLEVELDFEIEGSYP